MFRNHLSFAALVLAGVALAGCQTSQIGADLSSAVNVYQTQCQRADLVQDALQAAFPKSKELMAVVAAADGACAAAGATTTGSASAALAGAVAAGAALLNKTP
jgi:hypothetical protein